MKIKQEKSECDNPYGYSEIRAKRIEIHLPHERSAHTYYKHFFIFILQSSYLIT